MQNILQPTTKTPLFQYLLCRSASALAVSVPRCTLSSHLASWLVTQWPRVVVPACNIFLHLPLAEVGDADQIPHPLDEGNNIYRVRPYQSRQPSPKPPPIIPSQCNSSSHPCTRRCPAPQNAILQLKLDSAISISNGRQKNREVKSTLSPRLR